MKQAKIIIVLILVLSFATAFYFYPRLPDRVASHWNAAGETDGYTNRFWGAFLLPVIILALAALFSLLPKIDPLKANYEKFRKYFDGFIILILLYLVYVYALTLAWNLGLRFDFTLAILPSMAVLFYGIGVLTGHAKRNWFVGIRTPWTLSSDEVWDRTHNLGGKLFKAAAVLTLFGFFFGRFALYFFMAPVMAASIISVIYSYVIFRKLKSGQADNDSNK